MVQIESFRDESGGTGIVPTLARLRHLVDETVIGHERAKTGLLLAILAKEHAYLEGPPGCAKSLLAESVAKLVGAKTEILQLHRDVRESELLGDAVLSREQLRDGERIARRTIPGALSQAEIVILDDLSRAPGEALGPLLGLLEERRNGALRIPLESAFATALPPHFEAYVSPLEPPQIDRFAVQVRVYGMIYEGHWIYGRQLLGRKLIGMKVFLKPEDRVALQLRCSEMPVPQDVRDRWLSLTTRISKLARSGDGIEISDRTFARSGIGLLRAHAVLRGSSSVGIEDLVVVRYMLARRVPSLTDAGLTQLIEELAQVPQGIENIEEPGEGVPNPVDGEVVGDIGPESKEGENGERPARSRFGRGHPAKKAEVTPLIRAIEGRFDRGGAEMARDPGGIPRRVQRLDRFDEILDADPIETLLLAEGHSVDMPRALRRERHSRGGVIAVLRDVSASMQGSFARWACDVVSGIVRAGAKRRMRVGYLEFNHRAEVFRAERLFLHRRYGMLLRSANHENSKGRTNYQAPLAIALAEFQGRLSRNRHIVMLTDGVPVLGDPVVSRERREAARLGVRIHTVFIGRGEVPSILDRISFETGGVRFQARPIRGGQIVLEEREVS